MTDRAAIYARFSTDNQSDASVDDQFRICRAYAEKLGAVVVAEFSDAGISGSAMENRPGVNALMALARQRGCDVVIAENTDRISRAGEHSWGIYKRLEAFGVRYHTVNQGEVTKYHVGLSGLLSELFIEELGKKTRRGQEGVVLSGRAMGSLAYGYRVRVEHDAKGDRIPGLREIDEERAEIVRRIFTDYAAGVSPWALVEALNREGVTPPRSQTWERTTIIGNSQRGFGILRNELYRGVRVWGRMAFRKDPRSGARLASKGTGTVQRIEVPELRIVSDELWDRAQLRLAETAIGPLGAKSGQRRPGYLLAGLIRCGSCGGPMVRAGSSAALRCSTRAAHGASGCGNTRAPSYMDLESRVLEGVKANLLHPLAIAEAVKGYNAIMAQERKGAGNERTRLTAELGDIERRLGRLVREVEEGMPWAAVKARHAELTARQAALATELAAEPVTAEVIPMRANAAGMYRSIIDKLGQEMATDTARESREAIRSLIEEVRFLPLEQRGRYDLDITADLAPIVNTAYVRATESRSRFIRSHTMPVKFRLAG